MFQNWASWSVSSHFIWHFAVQGLLRTKPPQQSSPVQKRNITVTRDFSSVDRIKPSLIKAKHCSVSTAPHCIIQRNSRVQVFTTKEYSWEERVCSSGLHSPTHKWTGPGLLSTGAASISHTILKKNRHTTVSQLH